MTCWRARAVGGGGSDGALEPAVTTPLYPEDPKPGTILAVGTRTRGGRIELVSTPRPGEPTMRWQSQANSIDGIEKELVRIWAQPSAVAAVGGGGPDATGDADAPRGSCGVAINSSCWSVYLYSTVQANSGSGLSTSDQRA